MNNILPQSKKWDIAGREFVQEPLGLYGTSRLFSVIGDAVSSITAKPEFSEITSINTANVMDNVKLITFLMKHSPDIVIDAICIVLDADSPDDRAYIAKNAKLRDVMGIAKVFMAQNDIQGLRADFLELKGMWQAQATPLSPTPK